jgi:hypothetical protein
MSQERMLAGFALMPSTGSEATPGPRIQLRTHNIDTIALMPGTRLQRIIRLSYGWRLWTATRDYVFGSYLELYNDGTIANWTTREDEGDEFFFSRPADKDI